MDIFDFDEQIERHIAELATIRTLKKCFKELDIEIPTNVRKKLDTKEKKSSSSLDELMRKRNRMTYDMQANIEENM